MNEMSAQKRNQPGKLNIQPHPTSLLPVSSNKIARQTFFPRLCSGFASFTRRIFLLFLQGKEKRKNKFVVFPSSSFPPVDVFLTLRKLSLSKRDDFK